MIANDMCIYLISIQRTYNICKATACMSSRRFRKGSGFAGHERNGQSYRTPASWHHNESVSHFTLTSWVDDRLTDSTLSLYQPGSQKHCRADRQGKGKIKSVKAPSRSTITDDNRKMQGMKNRRTGRKNRVQIKRRG